MPAAVRANEVEAESGGLVGEDLRFFRGSGVGIFDAIRQAAGLDGSTVRLVGTVVAFTVANDS